MKSRLVLVAEDDSDTVEAYRMLFRSRGHRVESAADGPAVLVKAVELRPDVIVLDLGLPLMDGREVLRRLRLKTLPRIPVVVLTGRAAADVVAAVLDEGADHVMIKPCDPSELCQRVETLLDGAAPDPPAGDEGPPSGRVRLSKPRYRRRKPVAATGWEVDVALPTLPIRDVCRMLRSDVNPGSRLRVHAAELRSRARALRARLPLPWGGAGGNPLISD